MVRLIFSMLLILNMSCLGTVKKSNHSEKDKLFTNYLTGFESQTLPFTISREDLLLLRNQDSSLPEIKDSLQIFIPEEIKNDSSRSKYRSLYLFPKKNEIITVLIQRNLLNDFGVPVIKTYIINYNGVGRILSYQEAAGVNVDIWEALLQISNDYNIERKKYQFKINNDKNNIEFYHSIESTYKYKIMPNGLIKENEIVKIEGFFKRDRSGYIFVKPITNDNN